MTQTQQKPFLIIVADDLGLAPEVNDGIFEALKHGLVTAADLLVNPPFEVDGALFPGQAFSLGLHLNLSLGRPCSLPVQVSSLLGSDACFRTSPEEITRHLRPEEAAVEIRAQLDAFTRKTNGALPAHLSFHKHLTRNIPVLLELLADLAGPLKIPVRAVNEAQREFLLRRGVRTNDHFLGDVHPAPFWTLNRFAELLQSPRAGITELMCHPGRRMKTIPGVWYDQQRVIELDTLIDPQARSLTNAYHLVTFAGAFGKRNLT